MTIGLFDDHPLISKGISSLISENLDVKVLFAEHEVSALKERLKTDQPELLILDVVAPEVMGVELFQYISNLFPKINLIAYTSLTSIVLVDSLLNIGVKGFINKKQPSENIIECIREVMDGKTSVPPQYAFLNKSRENKVLTLTNREKEILSLIIEGMYSKEIADRLNISINTVENHRSNLFRKFQVQNVASLVKEAMELGF